MQTRQLGNSDLQITPVGYGAWAIGGSGWQFAWGSQDDNDSVAAIHRSLEMGVNWIDTAAVYGLGHSEEVVARALESWSGPRPYVFTKCGLRWDTRATCRKFCRRFHLRRSRSQPAPAEAWTPSTCTRFIGLPIPTRPRLKKDGRRSAKLKREGKVRWIGVSISM